MAKASINGNFFCLLKIQNRPDGRKYDGDWFDGKQHGIGRYTDINGKTIEAEWNMGRKVRELNPA
jgi:hypothetical protein